METDRETEIETTRQTQTERQRYRAMQAVTQ